MHPRATNRLWVISLNLWLVLPAFNEADNLSGILAACRKVQSSPVGSGLRIVLVDDGSTDDTVQTALAEAQGLSLEVLKNPRNLGLGPTFERGLRYAVELSAPEDVIFCMDADNSHSPLQMPRMLEEISRGNDVVIASRFRRGALICGVPLHRRFLARGLSVVFSLLAPVAGVRDFSSGFRAYRSETIRRGMTHWGNSFFAAAGFSCMTNVILKLALIGTRFAEIPIELRYDRKRGASKMPVLRTIRETTRLMLEFRRMRHQASPLPMEQ